MIITDKNYTVRTVSYYSTDCCINFEYYINMVFEARKIADRYDYYLYDVNPNEFFGCEFEQKKRAIKALAMPEMKMEDERESYCLLGCGMPRSKKTDSTESTKNSQNSQGQKAPESDSGSCSLI